MNKIELEIVIKDQNGNATLVLTKQNVKELYNAFKIGKEEASQMANSVSQGFTQARDIIQGFKETYNVIVDAFSKPISVFVDDEQAQVSFEVLLGNAEKAKSMLADLKDYGAKTPLEFTDLRENAKTLLNFNIAGKDIMPTLKMLGDVSGGDAEKLRSLTLAYAQVQSTGRLMGQDLLQLINAGFNPLQVISEKTGKSIGALKKEMEAGAISSDMITEAFKDVTSEGGRFYQMLEKQSEKLGGKISNFGDMITSVRKETGDLIGRALSPLLDLISGIMGKINEISPSLTGLIGLVATLTTVMVTLNVTGVGAIIKNIVTGFIPALTALKTSLLTLQLTLGPAGWLALGLTAIAGLWLLIAKNTEEAARAKLDYSTATVEQMQAEKKTLAEEIFRLEKSNESMKDSGPMTAEHDLFKKNKIKIQQMWSEIDSLSAQITSRNNPGKKTPEKTDDELKKEFDLAFKKLEIEQSHARNMLQIETDNEFQLLTLQKEQLEKKKQLYQKYGQDVTEVNYKIQETQAELENKLEKSVKPREVEKGKIDPRIEMHALGEETMTELTRKHTEQRAKLTEDLTNFEIWLFDEKATAQMQAQSDVLNYLAASYNQYTVMAKAAAVFEALLKAKQAFLTALAAFPPPFGELAAIGVAIVAAKQVNDIIAAEPPKMKGFKDGGAIVGEDGLEIISPAKEYAEGFAQVAAMTKFAIEAKMAEQTFQSVNLDKYFSAQFEKIDQWQSEFVFRFESGEFVSGSNKLQAQYNRLKF